MYVSFFVCIKEFWVGVRFLVINFNKVVLLLLLFFFKWIWLLFLMVNLRGEDYKGFFLYE